MRHLALSMIALAVMSLACSQTDSAVSTAVVSDGADHYILTPGQNENDIDVEAMTSDAFRYYKLSTRLHLLNNRIERVRRAAKNRIFDLKEADGLEQGLSGSELYEVYPEDEQLNRMRKELRGFSAQRVEVKQLRMQDEDHADELELVKTFSSFSLKAVISNSKTAQAEVNKLADQVLFFAEPIDPKASWDQRLKYVIDGQTIAPGSIHLVTSESAPELMKLILQQIEADQ